MTKGHRLEGAMTKVRRLEALEVVAYCGGGPVVRGGDAENGPRTLESLIKMIHGPVRKRCTHGQGGSLTARVLHSLPWRFTAREAHP